MLVNYTLYCDFIIIMALQVDSNDADHQESAKYWWHVNKSGFPICQETWDKMWSYVSTVHPNGHELTQAIQDNPNAKKVSYNTQKLYSMICSFRYTLKAPIHPSVPCITASTLPQEAMIKVQAYLDELQYPQTTVQYIILCTVYIIDGTCTQYT